MNQGEEEDYDDLYPTEEGIYLDLYEEEDEGKPAWLEEREREDQMLLIVGLVYYGIFGVFLIPALFVLVPFTIEMFFSLVVFFWDSYFGTSFWDSYFGS
jgi:uncharacterized protein YqhQ